MGKLTGWEKEINNNNILSIQMNLLNKCTSRCETCRKYTWPNVQLDVETIKRTIKVLKESFGLNTIVFSGGDPILYKNLFDVLEYCKELDVKFSLITTLITKNEDVLRYIAENAYRIHVSIDSMHNELYHKIRGVNALDVVKENVKFVQEIRTKNGSIPIRISSTMSKLNFNEPISLFEFAKENGCLLNFYKVHTWEEMEMDFEQEKLFYWQMEAIALDEKISCNSITNSRAILDMRYSFDTESAHCKKCYLPYINCTIDSNGDIYPCCKLLNDNGEYGEQTEFAYGNVVGKNEEELVAEFNKRFESTYPLNCDFCRSCADRYNGLLSELETIKNVQAKKPLFL